MNDTGKFTRSLAHGFVLLVMACGHSLVSADENGWQAGVARTVITPQQVMWMSGYASRDRPAEGTLHDLWAKALVLRDGGGNEAVLVTLDLIGLDRDTSTDICRRLQETHGLQRSQIALVTSHTHTGPVVGENLGAMYFHGDDQAKLVSDYRQFLIRSVADVVAKAFEHIAPASLSYGQGTATFAVNRRNNREADVPALREAGQLQGPFDHSAPVLAVRDTSGELTTIVFGYACHATVLAFYQWSGDWPGFAQIEIEKRHPSAVAMFVAGCGADQNPLPRRTVELAEDYGRQMADAVDGALSSAMQPVTGAIKTAYEEIDLALGELPSRETIETDVSSTDRFIAGRAKLLLEQIEANGRLARTYSYPVQVWAIGEKARTVILGGEVVVDFSLRLKAEVPDHDLWVAAYSNDVMAYIPSLRVLREGGYEGATSMIYYGLPTSWSEAVEEDIVQAAKSLLREVD